MYIEGRIRRLKKAFFNMVPIGRRSYWVVCLNVF
jgi:hypothetical protein